MLHDPPATGTMALWIRMTFTACALASSRARELARALRRTVAATRRPRLPDCASRRGRMGGQSARRSQVRWSRTVRGWDALREPRQISWPPRRRRRLRAARERERAAVDGLVDTAAGFTSEGHELSPAVVDRVLDTLHAAARRGCARAVRSGASNVELATSGSASARLLHCPARRHRWCATGERDVGEGRRSRAAASVTARLAAGRRRGERVERELADARKAAGLRDGRARRAQSAARALRDARERRERPRGRSTRRGALAPARARPTTPTTRTRRAQASWKAVSALPPTGPTTDDVAARMGYNVATTRW